jgi:hypothetical protein
VFEIKRWLQSDFYQHYGGTQKVRELQFSKQFP